MECQISRMLLKETQTVKAYQTESCKYCFIIAMSNIKISKTYSFLSKILSFSLFNAPCASFAFLNGGFSVLGHSTLRNFRCHKWSFVPLHKTPCSQYLQFTLFYIFNQRTFIQISLEFKHKLEFLIQSWAKHL